MYDPLIHSVVPKTCRKCVQVIQVNEAQFASLKVLSRDSVTVAVDAVVYYRVLNATMSVINVSDANRSTQLLAMTTLRNVLGTKTLSEILSDRETISHFMQVDNILVSLQWRI